MQCIINSEDWSPQTSAFPVLKSLSLDNLIHLKEMCHGPLPVGSFCNLQFLTVEKCSILLNVVPSYLFHSLQNLEVLNVKECDLLEEVFNLEGLDTHSGQMLPKLRELNVIDLPKLKHICNNGLGRIMAQEGADGAIDGMEFPQLSSLSLKSLPRLTGFYPGSQTLEKLHPGDFDHPMSTLFNEKVSFSCNFPFCASYNNFPFKILLGTKSLKKRKIYLMERNDSFIFFGSGKNLKMMEFSFGAVYPQCDTKMMLK